MNLSSDKCFVFFKRLHVELTHRGHKTKDISLFCNGISRDIVRSIYNGSCTHASRDLAEQAMTTRHMVIKTLIALQKVGFLKKLKSTSNNRAVFCLDDPIQKTLQTCASSHLVVNDLAHRIDGYLEDNKPF